MKKQYLLFVFIISIMNIGVAQNTVTVDASAVQNGYANVFETPANGGGFVFGQPWGVPELKTVLDASANTITLQPNFNTYGDNPTDPFWVDQTTGIGNKVFEGNTYVEDNTLVGSELTFVGGVLANTIDSGYDVIAFIKVFNSDFSVLKEETSPLVDGTNFSVNYTNVEGTDTFVQYGFKVTGINANPADEATLGSVIVGTLLLGVNDFNAKTISAYPNPVTSDWNVNSEETISEITITNMLGQAVMKLLPNNNHYSVDMRGLQAGMYVAIVTTSAGSSTVKLIKE